jgi:RimJ/RimL family protein N-acetyltransferase
MLAGELVTLRPVRADDLPMLYAVRNDPATWISASDKPLWPMPFTAFEEYYATLAAAQEAEFAVDAGGELVGRCALFEIDELSRNAWIGVTLGTAHRGKRYGRDVVRVLLDYAFSKRNLHRVQLDVLATNEAGLRAYKACGFVEEGRLREHAYAYGGFVDLVVMSILRSEWLAARDGR